VAKFSGFDKYYSNSLNYTTHYLTLNRIYKVNNHIYYARKMANRLVSTI
jgi:hypothetical protein